MKKLAAILCLSALTTGAFAQGLVNFVNAPAQLISANIGGNTAAINGPAGSYYFTLLFGASSNSLAAASPPVYGTNLVNASGGRFSGGAGVAVPGWAPGATMFYAVAGWSSSLGATFNPTWLTSKPNGLFGESSIASGVAGGGPQSLPPLIPFGGSGIPTGFTLQSVPEPSSMALAGLGAAALLIFRRRK